MPGNKLLRGFIKLSLESFEEWEIVLWFSSSPKITNTKNRFLIFLSYNILSILSLLRATISL